MNAYESPIHELSYAVLLVSKLQVFSEIWQDDYRSVGTVPGTVPPPGSQCRSSRSNNSATRATIHKRIGVCESQRVELLLTQSFYDHAQNSHGLLSESIFDCFTREMAMFEEQYLSNQSEIGHVVLRV